jgi:hypothetical protein
MFARLKIFLLLCGSSVIGWAASLPNVHETVAVYLKGDTIHSVPLLRSMEVELSHIMGQVRRDVAWWNPTASGMYTDSELVVITAKGTCDASAAELGEPVPTDGVALADTKEINGRILPFITIYCDRLNSFLAPVLSRDPSRQRQQYGQAMARLLAHELYHYLAQTHEHTNGGVTQRGITAGELLSTGFRFDEEASSALQAQFLTSGSPPLPVFEGR